MYRDLLFWSNLEEIMISWKILDHVAKFTEFHILGEE